MQAESPNHSIKSFVPILDWLPKYQKGWLRGDIIAAITIWALVVPEAMAYAASVGSERAKRKVGAVGFVANATEATAKMAIVSLKPRASSPRLLPRQLPARATSYTACK